MSISLPSTCEGNFSRTEWQKKLMKGDGGCCCGVFFEDGLGLELWLGLSESRASGSTMDVFRVRARDESRDLRGEELGPGAGGSWRALYVFGFSARSIRFSPFSRSLKEQHCG
jgi:hypothetical protein